MLNNQTQPINQIKPKRFHLKTWQWLSVLIIAAVIVGGVFAFFGLKELPSEGESLRNCSQNSDCYFTCDYGCINKEFEHEDKSLCNMPSGSCECINNKCQFVEDVSWIENSIKDSIQQANYCQTADDCVLLGEYCPFSNSWETYVNKQEKENIRNMIEDSQKKTPPISCEPSICNNVSSVQCVEGKCYVGCQDHEKQSFLFDINKLPIVEDCRKTADKEDFRDEEPTQEIIEYVNKKATILRSFTISPGYKIGRFRHKTHVFPVGDYCDNWFDVGMWDERYKDVLSVTDDEDLNKIFTFTNDDLENVGWLLHGDLIDREALSQKYNRAKEKSLCSESKTGFDCAKDKIKELPQFQDGEIVLENGKRTLHRYGTGCGPDDCLYHYAISVTEEGKLKIDEEEIYYVSTGIMW